MAHELKGDPVGTCTPEGDSQFEHLGGERREWTATGLWPRVSVEQRADDGTGMRGRFRSGAQLNAKGS